MRFMFWIAINETVEFIVVYSTHVIVSIYYYNGLHIHLCEDFFNKMIVE